MPTITVLPHPELAPDGAVFDAPENMSICDALLRNDIDMEHACGQVGACSTCHVVVVRGVDTLNALGDNEEDMLDQAWGLQPHSRLSCHASERRRPDARTAQVHAQPRQGIVPGVIAQLPYLITT